MQMQSRRGWWGGKHLLEGGKKWTCWECKLALPRFMLINEEQNISMYSCLVTVGLKASKSLPFTKLN